jgi:hypothetical protein
MLEWAARDLVRTVGTDTFRTRYKGVTKGWADNVQARTKEVIEDGAEGAAARVLSLVRSAYTTVKEAPAFKGGTQFQVIITVSAQCV